MLPLAMTHSCSVAFKLMLPKSACRRCLLLLVCADILLVGAEGEPGYLQGSQ